jgi:hypothetical protein
MANMPFLEMETQLNVLFAENDRYCKYRDIRSIHYVLNAFYLNLPLIVFTCNAAVSNCCPALLSTVSYL